jgi:tetratricopeptide (TPR) repeat protein
MHLHRTIDAAGSLEVALRAESVANKTGNPEEAALADSMLGAAYYMLADHVRAPKYLERALRGVPAARRFSVTQYLFDLRTTSLFNLTRSHWFAGNLDRAAGYAERTVAEAESSDHPIALCRSLILTMPLYFWIDELGQVEANLSVLELTAEKYSLEPFRAVAVGLRGRHLVRIGQTEDGMRHLKDSLEKLRILRYEMLVTDFVSELAVSLAKQDERAEAVALIDSSIAAQLESKRPLHLPALFLARGSALLCGESQQRDLAVECFEKAMTLARQQSALSFELRAGLELGRLWIDWGKSKERMISLEPFTADLPRASKRRISRWRGESSNRRVLVRGKHRERGEGLSRCDKPQALCARYSLRAPLHAQLGEYALKVRLHGLRADIKTSGDFLVGKSIRDPRENVRLATTQHVENPCTCARCRPILSCSLQTRRELVEVADQTTHKHHPRSRSDR